MSFGNGDDPGEYDPETQTYHFLHEWGANTSLSTRIIQAVAALTDTPSTEIDPLYHVVNPDALDHLFTPTTHVARHSSGELVFTLNECEVTVDANGAIEIQLPSAGES